MGVEESFVRAERLQAGFFGFLRDWRRILLAASSLLASLTVCRPQVLARQASLK